jgi:16S rRNA (guanine527-N7)-methyltransferase
MIIDDVSRGVFLEYQKLLLKWNKAINLISKNSEQEIWERHIIDSVQLINYIDFSDHVIDIGSGAGFPGIALSIAGVKHVTLIESDSRKVVFLRQAAKLSTNKIEIIEEKLSENFIGECDVLTCRGFSSIDNIFRLTRGLKIRKKIILLKGESYKEEIIKAQKDWLFNIKLHDSLTSEKGKILEITNERKSNFSC